MSLPENEKNNFNDKSAEENGFAENFVGAVREMYESENPNPNRSGCFSNEFFTRTANSAKLPDDAAMNHFFECSECFRQYRQALSGAKKTVETERKSAWQGALNFQPFKLALAGAGFVLLVGMIIFAFWTAREKPADELAKNIETTNEPKPFETSENRISMPQNQTVQNVPPPNSPTETTEPSINRKSNDNPPKNRQTIENTKTPDDKTATLSLILGANNILRDAANPNASRELVLPARRVSLNIKLPAGFSDGRYTIRLTDGFDKTLLQQSATAKNNSLSAVNLDLRNLKNQADKLCMQKSGEIPDCFDIKIAK